ncbi:hypothetical protein [Roseovarius sp. EL26]|uniref:hypothetical protein n=1 Tax=Roseovarius sp. EL26 TaxID=2126672 RepID=UPI000EA20137|nr:hypothetical protein [Roseovarius sp. EL26]
MSLDAALKSSMDTIPDCIAAGYIDMDTGMLLAMHGNDTGSAPLLETLSIAISNLFQGQGVQAFEKMLTVTDDDTATGFKEVAIFSGTYLYVFLKAREYADHVVCYICRDSANAGMVLTKSHMSLGVIAESM